MKAIIESSIMHFQETMKNADADVRIMTRGHIYALQNIDRWGIPEALILNAAKSFNLDIPDRLSRQSVDEWLSDEKLTREEFYNEVWDVTADGQ
jgi:hypothetical protein